MAIRAGVLPHPRGRAILLLCAIALGVAASCIPGRRAPAGPPRATDPTYWSRAAAVATAAAEQLRLLNYYNRAFADGRLSDEKFQLALDRQASAVFGLTQAVLLLDPAPRDAVGHMSLVQAVDELVRGLRAGRRHARDGQTRHLVQLFSAAADAQERLHLFVGSLPADADSPALMEARERVRELGQVRIAIEELPVHVLLVGPFDGLAQAEAVAEALGGASVERAAAPGAAASAPYAVRSAPYTSSAGAEEDAVELRAAGLEARIESVTRHRFRAAVGVPPTGTHWREPAWQQPLNLLPSFVDAGALGEMVYVASRDGSVQGWTGAGTYLWHRQIEGAITTLAAAAGGERAIVAGHDAHLLNKQGQPMWRAPFRPDGALMVESRVSADGQWLAVRTTSDGGEGRAHALSAAGHLWPTLPYIAAQHLSLVPSGSRVAVGSSRAETHQAIVISIPQGQRLHRYDLPGPVKRVALSPSGGYLAALTDRDLLLYQNEPEALLWRLAIGADFLHLASEEGPIYVGGKSGLLAISLQGVMLWQRPEVVAAGLWPSRHYLVAQVGSDQLDVYRADGSYLGSLSPLATIQSVALATDAQLLLVGDAERGLTAWRLP